MVLMGFLSFGYSQAKDNVARECVLFELFTGVRCQYCPAAANGVAQLLAEGKQIAPVAYHTSAFSVADYYTAETNARANYYGISSYPTLKADGTLTSSGGGSASESNYASYLSFYNQRINHTSPFTIDLNYEYVEGTTCRVNCTVTQVGECSGTNVRVFIALTQCNIDVSWQGMSGLHHVCRDMIPTQMGTAFTGPTMTISETFEMNWPKEDCYLTAWVQNYSGTTKEVYQAVRMSTDVDLEYDLVLKEVGDVVTSSCSGMQSPYFIVKNYGTQTVTSFDMCAFDGNEEHVQTWHGAMEPGEAVTVQMDDFEVGACEALQFHVANPNGQQDGFMADNYKEVAMEEGVGVINGYLKFRIKTDTNPEETVMQVKNMETGEIVQSFTFDLPKHVYTEEFVLPSAGCYRLSVSDSGGNGLGSGGIFVFQDSEGNNVFTGSAQTPFRFMRAGEVYCDGTWDVAETVDDEIEILPNPSNGSFYLNLGEGLWQVAIYDLTGREVHQESQFSKGTISMTVSKSGVYVLKATDGTKEILRKLMVY